MNPRVFTTVILPLMLLMIPGVDIVRFLTQRNDIWWTPVGQYVTLGEGERQVRVYVRGTPLRTLVDAGQLELHDSSAGNSVVAANEVGLRLNHWDKVRSDRALILLLDGIMVGFGFGLAAAGWSYLRRPPGPAAA
jgi:hypothetical protein